MITDVECILKFTAGALDGLRAKRQLLNRLNVFPVPDGDTGTNMYLTLLFGVVEMKRDGSGTFCESLRCLSRGVIAGSRGNSGFILCQFIGGLVEILSHGGLSSERIVTGMRKGVDLAYGSVLDPREGTILTVLREMVEKLEKEKPDKPEDVIRVAHKAAGISLMRTREVLEPLRKAGVVDAGGAGVVAALEGGAEALGISLEKIDWESLDISFDYKDVVAPKSGLRFVIECSSADLRDLKKDIANLGDSLIIAGSSSPYRIHIHTNFPFDVVRVAKSYGLVSGVATSELVPKEKVNSEKRKSTRHAGVLSICLGEGLASVFGSMGVNVMRGGPGKQPSAAAIAEALEEMEHDFLIVLPNDKDLIPTSSMALKLTEKNAEIIPTRSPLQGLAACEEYFEDRQPDELIERMLQASLRVVPAWIKVAIRNADFGNIRVKRGDYIGIIEDDLVASGDKILPVALDTVGALLRRKNGSYLTLVRGVGVSGSESKAIDAAIRERFDHVLTDWVDGGDTGCPIMMGIE